MPDLETLLRDVRPAPDPQWAMRLDARVAARFPGPPPRWKQALLAVREHLLALGGVATVATLVIVVISAVSVDNGDSTGGSKSAPASSGGGASATRRAAAPPPTAFSTAPTTARDVKSTTALTLTTTPG